VRACVCVRERERILGIAIFHNGGSRAAPAHGTPTKCVSSVS